MQMPFRCSQIFFCQFCGVQHIQTKLAFARLAWVECQTLQGSWKFNLGTFAQAGQPFVALYAARVQEEQLKTTVCSIFVTSSSTNGTTTTSITTSTSTVVVGDGGACWLLLVAVSCFVVHHPEAKNHLLKNCQTTISFAAW